MSDVIDQIMKICQDHKTTTTTQVVAAIKEKKPRVKKERTVEQIAADKERMAKVRANKKPKAKKEEAEISQVEAK